MTTLHVFSNRHIINEVKNIQTGDSVFLENQLSRKRWSLMFKYRGIDEEKLNINFITNGEYFGMNTPQFDNIVGNPPYQDGNQGLWQRFSIQAIKLLKDSGTLSFVTPNSWANGSNIESERNIFNSILKKYNCKEIRMDVNNDFKEQGHTIGKNISAWTVTKESYTGKTQVFDKDNKSKDINISEFPFFINVFSFEALEIFKKITNYTTFYTEFVEKKSDNNRYFAFPKAQRISYDSFGYRYDGTEERFPTSKVTVGIDCSDKSLDQVKSIHSQFESSVFRFLWKTYGADDAGSFGWILRSMPKLPDNKIYTNQEIYEILDLVDHKEFIEKNVK